MAAYAQFVNGDISAREFQKLSLQEELVMIADEERRLYEELGRLEARKFKIETMLGEFRHA